MRGSWKQTRQTDRRNELLWSRNGGTKGNTERSNETERDVGRHWTRGWERQQIFIHRQTDRQISPERDTQTAHYSEPHCYRFIRYKYMTQQICAWLVFTSTVTRRFENWDHFHLQVQMQRGWEAGSWRKCLLGSANPCHSAFVSTKAQWRTQRDFYPFFFVCTWGMDCLHTHTHTQALAHAQQKTVS
jgi:hypothetical protein